MRSASLTFRVELPSLLRGEIASGRQAIEQTDLRRWCFCVAVIVIGTGFFGAALGSWRAPLQSLFTAVKLPLILLLTALGNGLLNAMLAPLLGLNLGLRQSLAAVLMSFTIAAAILGAFSPLLYFLIWNTPPMASGAEWEVPAHSFILLAETAMIAFAGIVANIRLFHLLHHLSGSASVARKVLFGWLAGNLLLGSQLSWNLRPFVGAPYLPVEFLRPNAFEGNFFETIFHAARHLLWP